MPGAIIVGGGIAGLASGIAFANAGWEVTMLERAPGIIRHDKTFDIIIDKALNILFEKKPPPNDSAPFYRAMVDALIRNAHKIAALARSPEQLALSCSTKDSEAELVWFHAGASPRSDR
jgi:2-polyprenyl-6-methoxyphenol hydroxylase-like FAD-dependent oxidoreductase